MDIYDEIYYALIGQLEGNEQIPNAFVPGSECDRAYERLISARNCVLGKPGCNEDPDLSQMLAEMNTIQYTLCRLLLTTPSLLPQSASCDRSDAEKTLSH